MKIVQESLKLGPRNIHDHQMSTVASFSWLGSGWICLRHGGDVYPIRLLAGKIVEYTSFKLKHVTIGR